MRAIRSNLGAIALFLLPGLGQAQPSPPPFPCMLNRVDGAFVPGGYVAATGWAADLGRGAPVEKIEILLDGRISGEGVLSGLRPDVLAHFARADFLWSGWSAAVSLKDVRPGLHSVTVSAVSHTGKRVQCANHTFEVLPIPAPRGRPPEILRLELLARAALFLAWLALVGWAPARLFEAGFVGLRAPLLGLALFAVFAEGGAAARLRPFSAALLLTAVSAVGLAVSFRLRPFRLRRPAGTSLFAFTAMVVFAGIAAAPLAAHGEGAVLGDIDDAVREIAVAESINRYGWNMPAQARGYLAGMRTLMLSTGGRRGGYYILSALSHAFGVRAYAIYSVAMLAATCLVILASALLAVRILRHSTPARWLVPLLVAMNSTVLANLYGQHLGNLLAVGLFASFLYHSLVLLRSPRLISTLPLGLTVAGALTLYPEVLPLWALAGFVSLGVVSGALRMRALLRYGLAVAIALAINPVGAMRVARFTRSASRAAEFQTPYQRLITGDTHYFPSLNVVAGLEAYREDAPAPVGRVRRVLIPIASVLTLVVVFASWRRLSRRESFLVLTLLAPPALALLANFKLNFPYGYAKFLPLAVPVWSLAFLLLVSRLAKARREDGLRRAAIAYVSVLLTFLLALPSARHVFRRAIRAVPAFDPAFRSLPALAETAGREPLVCINTSGAAAREWMLYFLGETNVELATEVNCATGAGRFFLRDRRLGSPDSTAGAPATRYFALIPRAAQAPTS